MPPRRPLALLLLLVAVLALGGCGAAGDPPTVPTSGVDELTIPTPDPDPADFVAQVDNPWFPVLPDAQWTFETADGARTTYTATGLTREIDGVTVSELRISGGEVSVRWFAQDQAGNVWLFGAREGRDSWEAGVDGAQAGLAMPADPRRGDGWAGAEAPGLAPRVTVLEAEPDRTVLETTSEDTFAAVVTTYERGTGPVLIEQEAQSAELVEFSPGAAAR